MSSQAHGREPPALNTGSSEGWEHVLVRGSGQRSAPTRLFNTSEVSVSIRLPLRRVSEVPYPLPWVQPQQCGSAAPGSNTRAVFPPRSLWRAGNQPQERLCQPSRSKEQPQGESRERRLLLRVSVLASEAPGCARPGCRLGQRVPGV